MMYGIIMGRSHTKRLRSRWRLRKFQLGSPFSNVFGFDAAVGVSWNRLRANRYLRLPMNPDVCGWGPKFKINFSKHVYQVYIFSQYFCMCRDVARK